MIRIDDLMDALVGIENDLQIIASNKGHDYSGDTGDTFKNIRMASKLGLVHNDNQSCLIRLSDKLSRLIQLTALDNESKVKDEKVKDTTYDLMLYAFYNYMIWKDRQSTTTKKK